MQCRLIILAFAVLFPSKKRIHFKFENADIHIVQPVLSGLFSVKNCSVSCSLFRVEISIQAIKLGEWLNDLLLQQRLMFGWAMQRQRDKLSLWRCVTEYWSHGTCPQDTKMMLIFRHFRYQIDSYFLISLLSKGTSNCRQNGTKGMALSWLGFFCPCL